ncbi:DUF4214 domain-containing protein [Noviherbaspirillum sp.]|jgi:S-layer protein|uniref:beta strand repeat-containing protein n=1 Tax=Noviherbaspirillum sp. TaxID=1926288 RepID=UPI0025F5C283|nr:DUF4214 domain-containing protein [Noviherbaspirillum sp.]
MAAADYQSVVQQLYVAYFGRPADPVGLANFEAQLNTIGAPTTMAGLNAAYSTNSTIKALVDQFGTSAESAALYTGSTVAFVNAIYQNVLNRDADLEGLLFWAGAIDSGNLSRGKAAMSIMAGAQANTSAQGLIDAAVVANKTTIAGNFTAALDTATEVIAYSGNTAAATARAMLATVTNTTDTTAFQTTVNNTVATVVSTPVSDGTTFTLTTAADTGASFTGAGGNDNFVAQIAADLGTGTTFNAGDVLTGGSGTDTLQVSVAGASTAAVVSTATSLTGIEKVLVSNFDSNTDDTEDNEFNGALWTGVTTVGLSSSAATGDTSFTNLGNIVGAQMSSGAADLSVSYTASTVAGTADTQTLALNGVTAGTFTADAGIETVAITAAATATKSTLTALSATGASKLTIDADAAVTISGTLDTNIKTIDASASAAAVSLVLGTADLTVTGGAGDDSIRIAGGSVDANDSINAGTGTDTLQLTSAVGSAAAGAKLAGFENLRIYQDVTAAGATTITQDASYISGITNVGVSKMTYTDDNDAAADAATVTSAFTNMSATQTMSISGITSAGDADDNGAMTAAVSFDLASDTTADSGTITLGTSTAAAAVAGANNAITLNVTADDYETLTIVNQGGSQTIGTLSAADATSLTVNASKAFTITTLTAAAVKTIDASASTANVTIGATSLASTITGGAGNDTFTGSGNADSMVGGAGNDTLDGGAGNDNVAGGAGNDSITGGAGNDVLTGGDGDDTFADAGTGTDNIDGGAGNDTFTVASYASLTSTDTIVGGDGTDTLTIGDAGSVNLTTDITQLQNVSGVEVIAFSGVNGGDTVTINDGVVSTTGGALTLKFVTGASGANTIDASAVLSTASSVSFTDLAGLGTTYSIGNGKDNVSMGDGADTITVSNNAYLSSVDTLAGGTGSDTLSFTNDTAATNTITAAQLTNVTGLETFSINHATDTNLVNYVFTLSDTIVGNQVAVGSTFTITRDAAEDGTLKVDGSSVTSSYVLALSGEDGKDTLIGGAGNDSISGMAGNDSLTGGAGNDIFVVTGLTQAANGSDTITDFNFGTASTAVDTIKLDVTSTTKVFGTASGGITAAAGTEILILDQAAYQDASGAQSAARTAFGANDNAAEAIVIWQDTLGNLNLSVYADSSADATANGTLEASMIKFSGLTLSGVQSLIDASDFTLI